MTPSYSPPVVRAWRPIGFLLSVLAAAALACGGAGGVPTATPTALGVATVTVPAAASATTAPGEASATPPAEASATTPAGATDAPTTEPSATLPPTAAPPDVPEAILITSPGLGSHLASPLHVEGFAEPTFEQNLVIQITDANGGVLATQSTTIQADVGSAGPFAADVAFTTPADQPGRISVYSTSARDGGLVHLASVDVDLVTSGASVVELGEEHPEVHIILDPAPLTTAQGGNLQVVGYSAYVFEGALNVWLCGEGGSGAPDLVCGTVDNVIAQGSTIMNAPDVGLPGPFTLSLPYTVTGPVQARLVVYSTSPRDGGIVHLTTVPVNLEP
jgi:hypothetical protein